MELNYVQAKGPTVARMLQASVDAATEVEEAKKLEYQAATLAKDQAIFIRNTGGDLDDLPEEKFDLLANAYAAAQVPMLRLITSREVKEADFLPVWQSPDLYIIDVPITADMVTRGGTDQFDILTAELYVDGVQKTMVTLSPSNVNLPFSGDASDGAEQYNLKASAGDVLRVQYETNGRQYFQFTKNPA